MTLGTTALNPGLGGSQLLDDMLSTVNYSPAPAGARTPIHKLAFGAPGEAQIVDDKNGMPVSQVSPYFWRVGFAEVGPGLQGLAALELSLLKTGAGMAVNQAGGNLVVTTGITADAETVFRSVSTFRGALLARYQLSLSQRIANQTVRLELADLVGENLAYNIDSPTSVTVTFPTTNPFTAANVGQSLRLAVLSSVGIPGRWAIASVAGLSVTFAVVGWPAAGSGTLTLYGLNWMAAEYSGTVATNALVDAQRRGWANGNTTATIRSTAAPGHVGQIAFDVMSMGFADALAASNTAFQWAPCASRINNIPDEDVQLYMFLVVQNGNTAPASTTTVTVGFLSVEDQPRNKVRISGADPATSNAALVQVANPVTAVTATGVAGTAAEDAAASGNPVMIAGVARTANAPTTFVAGDTVRLSMTSGGQLVVKQFAPAQTEWSASLALTATTPTPLAAAPAAGIRNHPTSIWLTNTGVSAVDLILSDGASERQRYPLQPNVPTPVLFPTGITTTPATALNVSLSVAGTVRLNGTGYTAP